MVKRRSLNDALTQDEEIFLKQKTTIEKEFTKPKPEKKETPPMPRLATKEAFTPDAPSAANNPAQYSLAGTGSINARIDPLITTALLRASVERRISRQTPSTQRDIIASALSDWLKKHGYVT